MSSRFLQSLVTAGALAVYCNAGAAGAVRADGKLAAAAPSVFCVPGGVFE